MEKEDLLIRLFNELTPLRKTLASDPLYKKYRYTFDDMMGFIDDKIIHVFLKYRDTHPYEEIKALCISSMYKVKPRIVRNNVLVTDSIPDVAQEPEVDSPRMGVLLETLSSALPKDQMLLVEALLSPPVWIYERVCNQDSRIPSRVFLEYFGMEIKPSQIKKLNRSRRWLESFIKTYIDPNTLKFNQKYLRAFNTRA